MIDRTRMMQPEPQRLIGILDTVRIQTAHNILVILVITKADEVKSIFYSSAFVMGMLWVLLFSDKQ